MRWAIKRTDGQPFGIAAIWDRWKKPDTAGEGAGEWMRSFSLVTINATDHPLMQRFHAPEDEKRSIVILPPDRYQAWLHAGSDEEARSLLMSFNADANPSRGLHRLRYSDSGSCIRASKGTGEALLLSG